jgi:hypothetical protein
MVAIMTNRAESTEKLISTPVTSPRCLLVLLGSTLSHTMVLMTTVTNIRNSIIHTVLWSQVRITTTREKNLHQVNLIFFFFCPFVCLGPSHKQRIAIHEPASMHECVCQVVSMSWLGLYDHS